MGLGSGPSVTSLLDLRWRITFLLDLQWQVEQGEISRELGGPLGVTAHVSSHANHVFSQQIEHRGESWTRGGPPSGYCRQLWRTLRLGRLGG